jgi:TP901 family phage tail tape measure protein
VRTVKVVIEASVAGAIANVQAFKGTVADLGNELDRTAAKHPERLNKISSATGRLGIGMGIAFAIIAKSAMDFDAQMSKVSAVSDGGAASLGKFREAAIAAGRDTAFTATQAGQAEEELAKAGVSTADILGGALTGALNLAAAGSLDLGTAATIAAQAMTEFNLSGKEVGHIADVLTAGANKSTADVEGLGMALGQVGGVAHQTGLSLEDTVGVLARFTQGGMNGEEAGTTLKQTLLQLQAPSQQAADLMKKLGISIYDANGQFVGIDAVAQNLQDSLGGLDQAQRNAALGTIFGARAIRGATILYQEGAQGIQGWIDAVDDAGAAQKTADEKLNNLSGDLHKLLGSLQAVAVEGSGGVTAGLRGMTEAATGAVNWFGRLPKPVNESLTVLLGISAASLLATSGLLRVKTTVAGAMDALSNIGPVGERAAGILGKLGSFAGKLGLVGLAIFGVYEGFKALADATAAKVTARNVDDLATSLKKFADTGKAAGDMAKVFGPDLAQLGRDMDIAAKGQASLAEAQRKYNASAAIGHGVANPALNPNQTKLNIDQAKSDIAALDKALAQVASTGGATQAKIAFDKITASLLAQGIPLSQIIAMFPQYETAAAGAAAAAGQTGQGFGDVGANAHTMAGGLQDAIDHGETLTSVFKQLNGAALDLLGTAINEEQAIDDLSEKFKKGADALNIDTQAGRDNMSMISKAIQGAADAAQAKWNETGSVQAATDTYNQYIDKLKQTLHQLGLTDDQINQIISTYARMPPAVSTQFNAPGLNQANDTAMGYKRIMDGMDGRDIDTWFTTHFQTEGTPPSQYFHGNRQGGIYEHAASGLLNLRDASIYSPASPARYAFAEPATRGEAFIPRSGDLARSRAIADYVVGNWLGGSTSWGGGHGDSGGGGGPVNVTVVLEPGPGMDGAILKNIRATVKSGGGDVQRVLGQR